MEIGDIAMKRSMERILKTHVGSLTRPMEIIDAMALIIT